MFSSLHPCRLMVFIYLVALGCLLSPAPVWAEPSSSGRPELVVPKLAEAPDIDGVFSEGEWSQAAAISGFINAGGQRGGKLAHSRAKIFLGHDGAQFYVAISCDLPPGVKPSMNYRRRDSPVYMDRYQMEVWLAPPSYGKPVTAYQMIGNAYGAIYDMKLVPGLGITSSVWNGQWEFESTYETGKQWTAELAIPFSDLVADGVKAWDPETPWGGMVAVAWPQRSWPYTSGWYKNIQTHALMTMSEDRSAVRVDALDSLLRNTLDAQLTLINGEDKTATFNVRGQVRDTVYEQTFELAPNEQKQVQLMGKLPPLPEDGKSPNTLTLTVTGPDGQTLLKGDWPYTELPAAEMKPAEPAEAKPWAMRTEVDFAPDAKGLTVWTDLLDYPQLDQLESVRFTVSAENANESLATQTVSTFRYDGADAVFWLPKDLPAGKYNVHVAMLDGSGKVLREETKAFENVDLAKTFYWYGNDIAEDYQVAAPFTPIERAGDALKVWGRSYELAAPLPTQVTSKGAAMLAQPIRLMAVVDGKPVEAKATGDVKFGKNDGSNATFTGSYNVAGHTVELDGRLAFDGSLFYDMTLTPGAEAKSLDDLYLAMPVKAEHAKYYFTTAGGWSGAFGDVPAAGSASGDHPFWTSEGFAEFVPYIGLTDDERALQWFADNAHDWVLGDKPVLTLHRDEAAIEARIHLVQKAGKLSDPLETEFGFVASPIKPMPSGWRHTSLHYANIMNAKTALFYGSGHGGAFIDPHDTATLANVLGVDTKGQDPDKVLANLPPQRDNIDWDHAREVIGRSKADDAKKAMRVYDDPQDVHHAYFFNAKMYFEGNRSKAFRTFFPGDWTLQPPTGWFHLTPTESYRDFFTFHMDLWAKHWALPGLYFDEAYLAPDYNVMNGNGKVMSDGSVRPSIPLTRQREFMMRMWRVFQINGLDPFIWVHSSNYMAPHAYGIADVALFGEDKAPTTLTDYIDEVPAILMKTVGRSQKFGMIPVWMDQPGRHGDVTNSRQVWGWCWQHDVVPEYHTSTAPRGVLGGRVGWGIADDDVSFIPYWDNTAVQTSDEDIIVSAWTRPDGKVLMQVLNLNREGVTANLTLDAEALGLPAGFKVYNLESHPPVKAMAEAAAGFKQAKETGGDSRPHLQQLNKLAAQEDALMSYELDALDVVSTGNKVQIKLPARDFTTLIAE